MAEEDDVFTSPYDPTAVPEGEGGCCTRYCVSPTNGRLEWMQAEVTKATLNQGSDVTEEMAEFLLAGDKNPFDKPALLVHKTLGGTGDEPWNVFLEGNSFNRETYDNEVESNVFYAVSQSATNAPAVLTFKFTFKDTERMRPFKIGYQIYLPNGDVIENDLVNV
jgi:hypothetical protein